jgi:alkaline phosphatase
MVEQGDIDWANHANDYARMIGTVWDLHQAVQATIDFVNRPGDDIDWDNTLLIVTSDHGNSYMRLNPEKVLGAGDLPTQNEAGYPDEEVTYGTISHTNELVRLYAKGADAKLFERYEHAWYRDSAIIDNTHMFHVMMEAAGYPVESPLALDKPKVKKEKKEKKDKRDKDD